MLLLFKCNLEMDSILLQIKFSVTLIALTWNANSMTWTFQRAKQNTGSKKSAEHGMSPNTHHSMMMSTIPAVANLRLTLLSNHWQLVSSSATLSTQVVDASTMKKKKRKIAKLRPKLSELQLTQSTQMTKKISFGTSLIPFHIQMFSTSHCKLSALTLPAEQFGAKHWQSNRVLQLPTLILDVVTCLQSSLL